jgi:hypothetical protein
MTKPESNESEEEFIEAQNNWELEKLYKFSILKRKSFNTS